MLGVGIGCLAYYNPGRVEYKNQVIEASYVENTSLLTQQEKVELEKAQLLESSGSLEIHNYVLFSLLCSSKYGENIVSPRSKVRTDPYPFPSLRINKFIDIGYLGRWHQLNKLKK